MRIVMEDGCLGSSTTVDSKSLDDMTEQEKDIVLKSIIANTDNKDMLIRILMENQAEYFGDDEPCDQCGHWGATYILEIDEHETDTVY